MTGRESLRDRNRASGGREASPGIFRFIEFIEFVGLVELIKSVRKSLTDKLWMSMVFQKVFIG